MQGRLPSIAALLVMLFTPALQANEQWILTTSDFKSEGVLLQSIDDGGVRVASKDQRERMVPFDRFLQLDRAAQVRSASPLLVLWLVDGDRVGGAPVGLSGESLKWRSPALGELQFPLKHIHTIQRSGQPAPESGATRTEDVLTLANGDTLRGILSDVTATDVLLQTTGAEAPTTVPLANVAAINLAAAPAGGAADAQPPQQGFRVATADGSVLTIQAVSLAERQLRLRLRDGDDRPVPLSAIASIEHVNGPVIWLSDCKPAEDVQTPSFGQRAFPTQIDRSVFGEPIRVGDREFAHGIGVHAYSRLEFPVMQGCSSFRTQYAIDGDQPWANVTVRVKLDDRVVHEQANVVSGVLSEVVTVDLAGAKRLTLEVDYGENYDVQDRFNWIEPALLRK